MHKDSSLSEREKEVARILLQGKSNKQIALELGISTRTVEFHLGICTPNWGYLRALKQS